MGNCVEVTDRELLIRAILDAKYPSDDPEDRLAARELRAVLEESLKQHGITELQRYLNDVKRGEV